MGEIGKWLIQDEQKELFEVLFNITLNLLFLALLALLLWPLGMSTLALRLAKGYGILWIVLYVTFVLLSRIHNFFKVNIYDHADAFVISNLAVSCSLQAGWSAFAALTVQSVLPGASLWLVVLLYFVGVLSCLVASIVVSSCYQGQIYKLISLPLALIAFVVFNVWPAGGRFIYGWFFDFF